MSNRDDILKRILLNMKYDSRKTLSENYNIIIVEQSTNVGEYEVSYDKGYNRIKIESPSGKTYFWSPKGNKWSKLDYYLGNENYVDLTTPKDSKTISSLTNIFKKSGIGSVFYLKNTEQGNKFRTWVNKKDPQFSKSVNLSLTGPYDNESIRKAWVKYGKEYASQINQSILIKSDEKLKPTIDYLKNRGLDPSGAISQNHAYALSAVRATKKLVDKIAERIFGAGDSPYFVCVKKVGSTCSPDSYLIADTFDIAMAQKINLRKDANSGGYKPPQYTLLTNFYFDFGKIINDLQNAFKYDKNAYKSELFPDGWWNWFTTYWGTDNLNQIKMSENPKNVKVPGGGKGYVSGELTSSDVHTFLSVVEIGTLLLGLIPSPLSPILLGVSTAAGLADAGTYFYEGDKYMGLMMLALEVIPGGEFLKVLKNSKTAIKLGKEGTMELLEQGTKGTLKGGDELVYQELKKELKLAEKEIAEAAEKQIGKNVSEDLGENFLKTIKGFSPIQKLKTFYNTLEVIFQFFRSEFTLGTLPKMMIKVGGTMWSIDKLYLAVFGRDEDRQKSDIRKLYYLIQQKGLPEDEEYLKLLNQAQQYIEPNQMAKAVKKGIDINDLKKIEEAIRNRYIIAYNEGGGKTPESETEIKLEIPPIEEVVGGKKYIKYGMSGDEILKIKRALKSYYPNESNSKLEKTLNNSVFDDDFFDVIIDFQRNYIPNNTKEYGRIGSDTYDLIMNPVKSTLKPKTIEDINLDNLEKFQNDYDFYVWSPRTEKWVLKPFDIYKKSKEVGAKTEYSRKVGQPITTQQTTQPTLQNPEKKKKGIFKFRKRE